MSARFNIGQGKALVVAGIAYARGDGRGLAGSLAVHGLIALLIFLLMLRSLVPPIAPSHLVPVDIVHVGDETTSPPAPKHAALPRPFAPPTQSHQVASANRPVGTSPTATKPMPDEMETRLDALAHLKQPQSNTQPIDTPAAEDAAASDAPAGAMAAYAVRDLIRAQVLRKWNFDSVELGGHSFSVALKVVVLKSGRVAKVEVLDRERFSTDALYRDIAVSARNAVLLASPLTLPAGAFGDRIEVTLNLNPRDALR